MGGHPHVPNVSHLSGWETTVVMFWVELIPQNMAAVFVGQIATAAEENNMVDTQKIALLLGQIARLQKTAGKLSKELTEVLAALDEVEETLRTGKSPFGSVYPRILSDNE